MASVFKKKLKPKASSFEKNFGEKSWLAFLKKEFKPKKLASF